MVLDAKIGKNNFFRDAYMQIYKILIIAENICKLTWSTWKLLDYGHNYIRGVMM